MKISKRNKRIIDLLNKKIVYLNKLLDDTDNEVSKDNYITRIHEIRSCIWLLTINKYLNELEKIYKSKELNE